jgi:hypothetical protein
MAWPQKWSNSEIERKLSGYRNRPALRVEFLTFYVSLDPVERSQHPDIAGGFLISDFLCLTLAG